MEKPKKNMEQKIYSSVHYKPACIGGVLCLHTDHPCVLSGNRDYRLKSRHCAYGNVRGDNIIPTNRGISA